MRFDLRHLRCFVAVAEELHFRRAAERLGIAQPALSRTIRDLENDLGVILLERTKKFVNLTKAGQTFLDSSRGILSSVDYAVENTRNVSDGKMGSLRIAYTDLAIVGVLPNILRHVRDDLPDVALQFKNDVSINQLRDLEDDLLDVGFVTGPISGNRFEQLPISNERLACVVYDGHPLANRTSVRIEELAEENFVHGAFKEWEVFLSHLLPLCHRNGFKPHIVQEGLTSIGIIGLVAAGVGITVLTESIGNSLPIGVTLIPIEDANDPIQTVAVWKSENIDKTKRRFVESLRRRVLQTERYDLNAVANGA